MRLLFYLRSSNTTIIIEFHMCLKWDWDSIGLIVISSKRGSKYVRTKIQVHLYTTFFLNFFYGISGSYSIFLYYRKISTYIRTFVLSDGRISFVCSLSVCPLVFSSGWNMYSSGSHSTCRQTIPLINNSHVIKYYSSRSW